MHHIPCPASVDIKHTTFSAASSAGSEDPTNNLIAQSCRFDVPEVADPRTQNCKVVSHLCLIDPDVRHSDCIHRYCGDDQGMCMKQQAS
jgi:hypothetical protein